MSDVPLGKDRAALPTLHSAPKSVSPQGTPAAMHALWPMARGAIDKSICLLALPLLALLTCALALANPWLNPGPVFFRQRRMGKDGTAFTLWKFRTMCPRPGAIRGHLDPLEADRIPPLGLILRKLRFDEIPNVLNILAGEMSFIGPRPDMYDHAIAFSATVPRYSTRFAVKPGMTGLAQVRLGYADTPDTVLRKARLDALYIRRASPWLDLHICMRTIQIVLTGRGAK